MAITGGTLIGNRNPLGKEAWGAARVQMDLDKVFESAEEHGVAMEINCFPDRLDLRDVHCRQAKGRNVMMAIGTDAHSARHLDYIAFGIVTARRGWLERGDVMNALGTAELEKRLRGRRP